MCVCGIDPMVYNELMNEIFRFIKPNDTNQTFGTWKEKLPKYQFQNLGGSNRTLGELSSNYEEFDQTELFSSGLG